MANKILFKRGTAETVKALTLSEGEPAVALDTGEFLVGTSSGNKVINYTLPNATASSLGGVKVGDGITVTDGVISVQSFDGGEF